MKVVIVDGQGGRLGKMLVEQLKQRCPQTQLYAIGTNSIATATMLKAGADFGATGENPVVRAVMDADVVLGPMGIVVAHAILGEVTPVMAEAICVIEAIASGLLLSIPMITRFSGKYCCRMRMAYSISSARSVIV